MLPCHSHLIEACSQDLSWKGGWHTEIYQQHTLQHIYQPIQTIQRIQTYVLNSVSKGTGALDCHQTFDPVRSYTPMQHYCIVASLAVDADTISAWINMLGQKHILYKVWALQFDSSCLCTSLVKIPLHRIQTYVLNSVSKGAGALDCHQTFDPVRSYTPM